MKQAEAAEQADQDRPGSRICGRAREQVLFDDIHLHTRGRSIIKPYICGSIKIPEYDQEERRPIDRVAHKPIEAARANAAICRYDAEAASQCKRGAYHRHAAAESGWPGLR